MSKDNFYDILTRRYVSDRGLLSNDYIYNSAKEYSDMQVTELQSELTILREQNSMLVDKLNEK